MCCRPVTSFQAKMMTKLGTSVLFSSEELYMYTLISMRPLT